ncbi:MAG: PAS domain S-box protein [Gemmatimonadales bacterium]|nr:PAS domain S-box protein [Gemmatimonadales bacterium]
MPQTEPGSAPSPDQQELHAELLAAVRDSVIYTGLDGVVRYWNQGATDIFGFSAADMVGDTPARLYPEAGPEALPMDLARIAQGQEYVGEWSGRRKDGRQVWVDIKTTVVRDRDGRDIGFIGVAKDITARKEAERQLRDSEERYRAFVNQSAEGVWRIEMDDAVPIALDEEAQLERFYAHGYLAECNDAMARMYGFERAAELVGARLGSLLPAADPHNLAYLRRFIRSGYRLADAESHEIDRAGQERYFLNNLVGTVEGARLVRAWGSQRDITERKLAEQTLRANEARTRFAVDASRLGVWELDLGTLTARCSDRFERIFGHATPSPGWTYARFLQQVHPDDRDDVDARFQQARRSGENWEFECRIERADGRERWIWGRSTHYRDPGGGVPLMLGGVRDISDHRRTEHELRRVDRMEVVGQLAGGVAHEANNQMSVVLGCAAFIAGTPGLPAPVLQDVEYIKEAAERTANITRQLLAFSRRQVLHPEVLDLNALLEHVAPLLRRTLSPSQSLRLAVAHGLPAIRADRGQIEQVLFNLALNARDAMPSGGTLTLATSAVTLREDDRRARGVEALRPGGYVRLAVSDTGAGMDRDTLARAFEPFFTTKTVGLGTGLGLATVYGIVKQSGGYIAARSVPGEGTTFDIDLPEHEGRETASTVAVSATPRRSGERVLVVEDEPMVRRTLVRVLQEEGYAVLEAGDGRDAMALLDGSARPDLIVTDVQMPQVDGRELAGEVERRWPGLPVLFTSGFGGDHAVQRGLIEEGRAVLQKPLAPETLLREVRTLLDRSAR